MFVLYPTAELEIPFSQVLIALLSLFLIWKVLYHYVCEGSHQVTVV